MAERKFKTVKTGHQIEADKFDCELYRLISWSRNIYLCKTTPKKLRDEWIKIHANLVDARALVRSLMHEDDRETTAGF